MIREGRERQRVVIRLNFNDPHTHTLFSFDVFFLSDEDFDKIKLFLPMSMSKAET